MNRLLLAIFALAFLSTSETWGADPKEQVHVAFLSGFMGEQVVLFHQGVQVYSDKITTNGITGVAAWIDLPKSESPMQLKVEIYNPAKLRGLPAMKSAKSVALDLSKGSFLYVSLAHDQLKLEQSKEPFALD